MFTIFGHAHVDVVSWFCEEEGDDTYSPAAIKETRHVFSGGLPSFTFPYENTGFSYRREENHIKTKGFQSLRFSSAFLNTET